MTRNITIKQHTKSVHLRSAGTQIALLLYTMKTVTKYIPRTETGSKYLLIDGNI